MIVQAGGVRRAQFESVEWNGVRCASGHRDVTVRLAPGAGATLTLAMRRYVNQPTVAFPWAR